MNELEQVKKEKDGLDSKLTGIESASKDPDTLLESQRTNKNKEGLGYDVVPPSCSRESSSRIMSKPIIKFVKATDSPTVIKTNKVETAMKSSIKYAEMYRNTSKSPKVRGNQRSWNNLKTQQLGKDFVMKNKACFKCGHFDHLAYDCGVWVEKWKNWPKNNLAHNIVTPRANFLKTGRTPIVVNRTNMNVAQPKRTSFAKTAHSYVRRSFQGKLAFRTQPRVLRVSTVTKRFLTVVLKFSTAKSTFSADLGNKGKVVKASACWIRRPKQNTTKKYPKCNSVSVIFKKYQYIDTQGRLKSVMAWVPKKVKKEKYGLDSKLTGFESACKDPDTLLESHRTNKNKEGLGYDVVPPFCSRESSSSIMSKPMIKFVKATDSPTVIKTNKVETAMNSSVKYAEMYRNTSKSPKVRDSLNTKITKLNEALSDGKTNLYHYKLGLSQVKARLVEFKTQEIKFCKKIIGLEFDVKVKNNKIENLMNELEQVKKEKDGLDSKLTGFESASKDPDTLLESQRTNKNKEGLGYDVVPPSCSRESSSSIMSKPMIKFVKATDSPTVIKTNKVETAIKSFVKYAKIFPTVDLKFSTAKSTFTADLGNKGKVVKASACWIRRPKQNTIEKYPNCNSVSVIFKKYQYIDTQGRLKSVMAWVPKKKFALLVKITTTLGQRHINISQRSQSQEKDTVILKLKERLQSLSGNVKEGKIKMELEEIKTINIKLDHRVTKLVAENEHLKQTYKQLTAHTDYFRHTQEETATLRVIVKRTKLMAVTPKNNVKNIRFIEHVPSSGNTPVKTTSSTNVVSNTPVLSSTGVNLLSNATGSQPQGNTKNDRIQRTPSKAKKNKLEDHPRTVKTSLNKKKSVVDTKAISSVTNSKSNVNFDLKCATCNGCLFSDNHDLYVLEFINAVNARVKSKSVKKPVNRKFWQPTEKMFTTVGHICRPT
nr:integrase, catalytic region, zinc finger, CCHC-type, peptidase aspartic, catalytic [Tanacetum cinerariifolium]